MDTLNRGSMLIKVRPDLPDPSQQSVQLRQRTDHSMWSSAEELLLTRSRSASIMVSGCERYSYSGMGARYWGRTNKY